MGYMVSQRLRRGLDDRSRMIVSQALPRFGDLKINYPASLIS